MTGRSKLYGREGELARLLELTEHHHLVTVTGPGGVGKTRLVEESLASLRVHTGDRVHDARLADLDAGADVAMVSMQLGFASPEALAVSVGDERAIVVLDNCEHLLGVVAELTDRLLRATSTVVVVTTSREPLGLRDEQLLVLEPLQVPELGDLDPLSSPAAAMFLDRARAGGARWEHTEDVLSAVAVLCQRVDGLPLAIELAASRARTLSPAELLALLDDRLDVLRTRDSGRPERHRSVRAAIDVSTGLLGDDVRGFFHRLGAFAGSFDLDLAHAVAGPEPGDRLRTVDLISELVERSLVVAEPTVNKTRYRLLELVREYALDALDAAGKVAETSEHLTAVMASEADEVIGEGVQGWSAELVGRIVANVGNFSTAVDWCIGHDATPDRALRLFLPLFAAVHQSRSAEVRAVGDRIFQRWPDVRAPLRAEALAVLSTAYAIASEAERSAELANLALHDPDATSIGEVLATRALTLSAIGRGDVNAAYGHATEARARAAAAGLLPFEREMAGFEASLLDRAGRHDEADVVARDAVEASIAAGDPITEIWTRLVVATVAMRAGRFRDAHDAIDAAQATSHAIQGVWWSGAVFRSQALLASYEATASTAVDGWDASRELWRAAIEGAARKGDLAELALTLKLAAVVAARAGRVDAAHVLLDAVPPSPELTVLPELFDEERAALEAARPPAPPGTGSTLVVGLRRAMAVLLGDAAHGDSRQPPSEERHPRLRREGAVWAITFGGGTVRVRDSKGVRDLSVLLSRPGTEVHCLELMGAVAVDGTGPELDDAARRRYESRIIELQDDIDEARSHNDGARAEKAEVELDLLVQQLSQAFGLGGRARSTGSSAEKARTAVTYRIRTAIKRIGEVQPELGRHLTNAVRTGAWCVYHPETSVAWRVETGAEPLTM